MALVKGINCGFVDVVPVGDPSGITNDMDGMCRAFRDITPVGVVKIIEIGWWCNLATAESNFEVGIYEHDSGADEPGALLGVDRVNAKGTTKGWKRVAGLDIAVSGSTVYWIAVQMDNINERTELIRWNVSGEKFDRKLDQTEIVDPWGSSDRTYGSLGSIYAVVESGEGNGEVHSGSLVKNGVALEAESGLYV